MKRNVFIIIISVLILTCLFISTVGAYPDPGIDIPLGASTTTDLELIKPEWTDEKDILDDLNANWDILEAFANDPLEFDTGERLEDRIGVVFTGNTETFVTVTYQDADNTVDVVVPVLDEDAMSSNSAVYLATQQSIKAYVDNFTGSTNIVTVGTIATGVWQGTAIADAYIPNSVTIDLATLATTFTCTDNENEALACPIVFVDGAIGAQGAETDNTDFTYTPSTGNLSATQFEGITAANLLDKSDVETITSNWVWTGTAGSRILTINTYSDTATHRSKLRLRKSHQDTVGYTATVDNEDIGSISAYGVGSDANSFDEAARILFEQDGAAGAANVPGRIVFQTATNAAVASAALTLNSDKTADFVGAVDMPSLTLDTALAIAEGGTGQITQTAAFDALAPTTTQGDILYYNGSDNVRLAKGTATQVLAMNAGATAPEWVAASGYTNLTSFVDQTAWRVFYSNAAGDIVELALGADGTYLKSNGAAAAPTFTTPAGAGDVTKVGTPANSQVGVWTGDGTIEGAASFTYDGSNLQITGDIGATGSRITKGWFANLETTGDLTVNGTALASTYATLGANTNITSILNVGLYVGRDADNQIKFATDNNIIFRTSGADGALFYSTGELDMNAHSVGFTLQTATGDGTTTIDWKLGNKFKFTFGAQNDTLTFTAPTNPGNFMLWVIQDGTGSRLITWPTIRWAGGTAPTLSTAAGSVDIIGLVWDGTNWDGVASLAFAAP